MPSSPYKYQCPRECINDIQEGVTYNSLQSLQTHHSELMAQGQGLELGSMESGEAPPAAKPISQGLRKFLMVVSFGILVVGGLASPLLLRVYFLHGGSRKWLSSWVLTVGFPIILVPLSISYFKRRRTAGGSPARVCLMTAPLLAACVGLGVLTGINSILYAVGVSHLPASTSAILSSTQLAFTALMAFLIVRQRFTLYTLGAVALLTVGTVVLGLSAGGDRPKGESRWQYYMGFFMTLGGAAISGLQLPLVELMYSRTKQAVTYTLVCEVQLVMSVVATVFSTVGMLINKDFQAISREARTYSLGEFKYYEVIVWSTILWQLFYLGIVGAIFYASALLAGIIQAVTIPITGVLAIIFLHENFTREKGIALGLAIAGFIAYFYEDIKELPVMKRVRSSKGSQKCQTNGGS